MNEEYKLIPLQETQSIPVNWKFSRDDYDKLLVGHRSNWCVFLRGDAVHICRVGGEEFYRFSLKKSANKIYTAEGLEMYMTDNFSASAESQGWTKQDIEKHQAAFRESAVNETVGLLLAYFGIDVTKGFPR